MDAGKFDLTAWISGSVFERDIRDCFARLRYPRFDKQG